MSRSPLHPGSLPERKAHLQHRAAFALGLGVLVAVALAATSADRIVDLVEWVRASGARGVAVFSAIYVIGTLAMLPGSLMTMAGGFAYGVAGGFVIVLFSSLVGATAAFGLGRSIGRRPVERLVARDVRLAAVDRLVEERGLGLMLLLRLSPVVPYSLLNYALGLTRVSLPAYVLAGAIGMLPGTLLYVYLGSSIVNATALLDDAARDTASPAADALYWVGLAATVAAVFVIARLSRRAIQDALADAEPPA